MIIVVQQVKPVVLESAPRVLVAGSTGLQGPGVPAGGTTGQALVKASNDDNDTEWADQTGSGAALSDDAPAALGVAAAGTGEEASRDDHVHAMPSAGDVGAAAASHAHAGSDITSGTIDGDRLPAMSQTKGGAVPATGVPSGLFLRDDGTWAAAAGGSVDPQAGSLVFGVQCYAGGW
jgi:hypothetical protein